MATIQEALAAAVRHHQSGQLAAAARIYRRIIEIAPDQTDALHLLGLVVRRAGQAGGALRLLSRALRLDPAMAEPRLNLGNMLRDHGHGAAAAAYRSAIALRPELAAAYENLGGLHRGQGRSAEAERACRRAIRLNPMAAEGHNGLANVLQERDELDGAVAAYRRGLAIDPAHTAACNNMGIALRGLHRTAEATACHRRAVRLDPHFAAGHTSLGLALQEQGRLEEAACAHARAVAIDPAFAGGHANHGNARLNQNRLIEAVAGFRRAVAIDPAGPDARRNLGMALLVAGRFEEGWREYEWRLRCKDAPTHATMPKPRWNGEPLDGRRILLHGEQGLGDALQFCRYVPLVAARGGRVILGLPAPLERVMAGLPGVERFVSGQLPTDAFDLHLPMLSLGEVFGTQMDTIPHRVPYLTAEPDLAARWGERLKSLSGLKVGIVWAGSPTHGNKILIDHFLDRCQEAEVDAICDGEEVHIMGIMEHIEPAGIHSGDSHALLPVFNLGPLVVEEMADIARKIALRLNVKGLINIQFAIKDNKVYVIEANPRASRTTPFIAKAYNIPYLNIATKVMLGEKKLKDFVIEKKLDGFAVKEPVFSFNKFPNVNKELGPEMKSTGEAIRFIKNLRDPWFRQLYKERSMHLSR